MLKSYQRETKLFEFSRDKNRGDLKIRKNDVTMQWLCCNEFCFSRSPMFTNKATIFLHDVLYWKISAYGQRILSQKKRRVSCKNVFIMATKQ